MIKKSTVYIIIIVIILSSFGKNNNRSYQTECVTIETDGYVTIKIWDTKKGYKYNSEDARKDAIDAILFSGISGGNGCTTQSPILNKTEEQEKFNSVEKSFFSKKGKWSIFTRSSAIETTLPVYLGVKNEKGPKIRMVRWAFITLAIELFAGVLLAYFDLPGLVQTAHLIFATVLFTILGMGIFRFRKIA
jgi:hypothetical protein